MRLITPWDNNKPVVRDYLLTLAARSGFDVRLLPDMSHFKGILIDGERLVVGSCNFDFVGLAAEEELVAVIESPALIAEFQRRVIGPAQRAAATGGPRRSRGRRSSANGRPEARPAGRKGRAQHAPYRGGVGLDHDEFGLDQSKSA